MTAYSYGRLRVTAYSYGRLRGTASRLIARFGQPATLIPPGKTDGGVTGNPWDPSSDTSPDVRTRYACSVVVTDYTLSERRSQLIQAGSRKILLSVQGVPDTVTIGDGWRVQIGGVVYTVVPPVTTYDPGGTVLCYEMQAKT